MGIQYFDSLDTETLTIKFNCEDCGDKIEEELEWDGPDFGAERARDATGYVQYDIQCHKCGSVYPIEVVAELGGGHVILNTEDEEHEFELIETYSREYEEYLEDIESSILDSKSEEHLFVELSEIKSLLELKIEANLYEILLKQSYVHAITIMESFLFEIIFKKIKENPSMQEEFVKNHEPFRTKKITISEIHLEMRSLYTKVKQALVEITFHNLHEVKKYYSSVLNINIGDTSDLMSIVSKRHDLVHRNGKDKEGAKITLTKEEVISVLDKIEVFMRQIEKDARSEPVKD